MSDYDKSDYTKTGKKVKSINSSNVDLTYNKIYEVFVDIANDEFIIDDVGDWRYVSMDDSDWYELADDAYSDTEATNTTDDINDTIETKPKFKVGDKVKVVDIAHISQYVDNVKVGDVGVIIDIANNYNIDPYLVKFEDSNGINNFWFTNKCIELVEETSVDENIIENDTTENTSIVSDGGSSSYYAQQIPKGMLERFNTTGTIEAKDVIRLFLGNDFNMGNIFKAYCRVISLRNGKGKAGIDEQYDLTKAKFFAEDELNYYLENTNSKTRN